MTARTSKAFLNLQLNSKDKHKTKNLWLQKFDLADSEYPYNDKYVVLDEGFPQEASYFVASLTR